jgi:two-component system sensor histidine kinase UhpB
MAALVCASCYLGSVLDIAVSFPGIKTAILFPSYAILTAALLLSSPAHWWLYLLASSAGNFFPHHVAMPLTWVLLAEGVNYGRALIAAAGVLSLTRAAEFNNLRGIAAFLCYAVFLAPCLAAFAGAGVVMLHRGTGVVSLTNSADDYWLFWQAWFFSNALTGLTLLPVIVMGLTDASTWMRQASLRKALELALLLAGILSIGILVFLEPYGSWDAFPARLFAPLPILLWGAVRFGPAGASGCLLGFTILAIWGTLHQQGPFVSRSSSENLLSLQLFLSAMGLPLLVLAALMEERLQTARALQLEMVERNHGQEALKASYSQIRELASRLITVQEAERTRIARELHDDINQQVATLSIALSSLKRRLPECAAELGDEVTSIQGRAVELANAVRQLSHELHPGVLQHVGLQGALEARCAEFRAQQGIAVKFNASGELASIPQEISLCLYRVVQEAFSNIARHAHARAIEVSLARTDALLQLDIVDDGQGFDLAEARHSGGLGLLDMDERARIVMGSVSIDTQPHCGTHVRAEIPLGGLEHVPFESTACG